MASGFVAWCQRYLCYAIVLFVTLLFDIAQIAHLFVLFNCSSIETDIKCFTFLYIAPYYIAPLISVLAMIVGCCAEIPGVILHILAGIVNIGAIAYHIGFLRNKLAETDEVKKMAQIVTPCVVMGVVVLFSLICAIVTCVMFVYRKANASSSGYKGGKNTIDYNKLDNRDSDL